MSSNEIAVPAAVAAPDRIGQATAVEQSRAIAEVQGAILVAQRCPRDVGAAVASMRESCAQKALAERAFFRFPRAGGMVTGPSVYLARELARTWGNVQYGVSEMRRDDGHGQSEMLAYAWDVQTNTRVETKFVVPHMRDKRGGPERLTDMRDIYENNANSGARRVRECIFSILPPWFVDEAKDNCRDTLAKADGDKPLPQRIADAVALFGNIGVSRDQLERRAERPISKWTVDDVVQLGVVYKSLQRGEIRKEDEFPAERLSPDDLGEDPGAPVPTAPAQRTGSGEPEPAEQPARATNGTAAPAATKAQLTKLHATLGDFGVTERADKLATVGILAGRPLTSSGDLTKDEASQIIETLGRLAEQDEPARALDVFLSSLDEAGGES